MTDDQVVALAIAIIEEAVNNWFALNCGDDIVAKTDNETIWKQEVEGFFLSPWFETLCHVALPSTSPEDVRSALKIGGVAR